MSRKEGTSFVRGAGWQARPQASGRGQSRPTVHQVAGKGWERDTSAKGGCGDGQPLPPAGCSEGPVAHLPSPAPLDHIPSFSYCRLCARRGLACTRQGKAGALLWGAKLPAGPLGGKSHACGGNVGLAVNGGEARTHLGACPGLGGFWASGTAPPHAGLFWAHLPGVPGFWSCLRCHPVPTLLF